MRDPTSGLELAPAEQDEELFVPMLAKLSNNALGREFYVGLSFSPGSQREKTRSPFLRFQQQAALLFALALRSRKTQLRKQRYSRDLGIRPLIEERLFLDRDEVAADGE
jgi:hypothetical protein